MIPNDFDEEPCTDPDCECWDDSDDDECYYPGCSYCDPLEEP